MSGYLLHQGATVLCTHGGQAQPTAVDPRVKVNGQSIVTQSNTYTISGCSLPAPPNGNGPCVSAQWIRGATRVKAGGTLVLLQDSQASCTPTGTGLNIVTTQTKVRGI